MSAAALFVLEYLLVAILFVLVSIARAFGFVRRGIAWLLGGGSPPTSRKE